MLAFYKKKTVEVCMKTEELVNKETCCGCSLCRDGCPAQAIRMVEGALGVRYPEIDESKCVNCHLCEKKCPVNQDLKSPTIQVCAAVNTDREMLMRSASGGVFSALAVDVLRQAGVVYGAAILPDEQDILKVKHIRVDAADELHLLQGSKYLQSDMTGIYAQIKKDVKEKRLVLFSGTPCQVAAVKSFCGTPDNLLLVEIICHGTPSQKLFSDYLRIQQKKKPSETITGFRFRTKESGWGLCASLLRKDKKGREKSTRIPCQVSSYYSMFLHCEIYRGSCYRCKYAAGERVGDLTIGDYWGVQKDNGVYSQLVSDGVEITDGVSCVVASSQKGIDYLEKAGLKLVVSTFDSISKENGQLLHPSPCPSTRGEIVKTYEQAGYAGLEKQFNKTLGVKKYVILCRNRIPPKTRMRIRMLLRK